MAADKRLGAVLLGALLGVAVAFLASLPSLGAAGDPAIAKAVAVRPEANGQFNGATKILLADEDLFEGQKIVTGSQGEVQIVFADDTHLVVGAGSSLVIEKYLMRNGGTASSFAVSALGGTFRFITGKSQKSAYRIDTPTGTIGVRGTKFDFSVDKDTGETTVVLFEGAVKICPKTGSCQAVGGKCDIGLTDESKAQVIKNGDTKHTSIASDFPYVSSQTSLRSDFRVRSSNRCDDPPEVPETRKPDPKPEQPSKPDPKPDPLPDPKPN